jgi:hypothetical protein
MQALANQAPASQQSASTPQTASTPTVSINDRAVHDPNFPDFRKPTQKTASAQQTAQPPAATQQTPPPQSSPATPTDISTAGMFLLALISALYPIGYVLFCLWGIGFAPRGKDVAILSVESVGCMLVTLFSHLLTGSVAVLAILLTGYILIRLFFEIGRVAKRRDSEKARELAAQLETQKAINTALVPLLNQLNGTYGRYSDMPELIPASWYQPRKHYIEYMADVLYTSHAQGNTAALYRSGITADSHPLDKLRFLPFPSSDLQPVDFHDPRHPLNVIKCAITDSYDHDHNIFRGLIPQTADLLPYLTAERWQEPLARQAHELEMLVTQEITKQQSASPRTVTSTPCRSFTAISDSAIPISSAKPEAANQRCSETSLPKTSITATG